MQPPCQPNANPNPQGFELADPTKLAGAGPNALELDRRSGTESYFSSLSGFRSIRKLG